MKFIQGVAGVYTEVSDMVGQSTHFLPGTSHVYNRKGETINFGKTA